MSVVDVAKLERVLQAHWTEFMDSVQVMRVVLEHVRDTDFRVLRQAELPPRQTRLTVTRFTLLGQFNPSLEAWIEFTVPKGDGVVIGTVVAALSWSGDLELKESFGTEFQPENLKQHPES